MSLPESTQRRLDTLTQTPAYHQNAVYHAQVATFRNWLLAAEMAMRDEGVPNGTIEKVLNRMVYGTPVPFDPEDKMVMIERDEVERLIMNQDPRRRFPMTTALKDAGLLPPPAPNRPGHRDVADLYTDKGRHGPH